MNGVYYLSKNYFPLLILSVILLSSCGSYKKTTLFNSKYDVLADTSKTVYVANGQNNYTADYIIRVGDRLQIRNLQDTELPASSNPTSIGVLNEGGFLVEIDSTILLPALGKFKVAGLIKETVRGLIEKEYKDKLLKNPIIELNISNFTVSALGDFNKVGKITFDKHNPNLIEIIGLCGGITEFADPRKLKIIRGNLANPEIIFVNLTDINSLSNSKTIIQNKDILYLPKRRIEYINNNIRPINALIQPLLILINTALVVYSITR